MFVTAITVRREGYYAYGSAKPDPSKAFNATVELHGSCGKVELNLSPELSRRVVDVIAEEVATAGRATAEAMTADFVNATPKLAKSAA